MTIRVLIADDQAMVRAGLRSLLDREPDIDLVADAVDGESAVAMARRHRPDVILMDIRMPVVDGLTGTRQLCAQRMESRVLILTTFDLDEYVSKRCAPEPVDSCSRTPHPNSSPPPFVFSPKATHCLTPP